MTDVYAWLAANPALVFLLATFLTVAVGKGIDFVIKSGSFRQEDNAVLRKQLLEDNKELRAELSKMSDALEDVRRELATVRGELAMANAMLSDFRMRTASPRSHNQRKEDRP